MSTHADGPAQPASIPELNEMVCSRHFNSRMVSGITMADVPTVQRLLRLSLLNAFLADKRADGLTKLKCENVPKAIRRLRDEFGTLVPLCCWLGDVVATTAIGAALNGNVYGHDTLATPDIIKT